MTEQQQQSYSDYYNPYFSMGGAGYDNRVGLVKELSPRLAVINAIRELAGEIKDPETNKIIQIAEPIMNKKGRSIFFHAVTAGANEINTFSNYRTDDKLIYRIMKKWVFDITYEFYYNRKDYEIKEESHSSFVINKAVGLILPSFFKALGAGDRSSATRAVQETIQRAFRGDTEVTEQKRRGFLSRMNPFSRA